MLLRKKQTIYTAKKEGPSAQSMQQMIVLDHSPRS